MGEVKQLKLHIRILYIAITALLAWTVVLSLLPPKSHYRDVTLDDITISYTQQEREAYRLERDGGPFEYIMHWCIITINSDVAGFEMSYKGKNGSTETLTLGDIEKGHSFSIHVGNSSFLDYEDSNYEISDIILSGKINIHLD